MNNATSLYDLGQAIVKIREAINSLETKGQQNAAIVVYCCERCNDIIRMLNETASRETQLQKE